MAAAAGLAVVAFSGAEQLWLLYLLATLSGVALVFDNPSKHALIYQLVGREELQNAVSLNISLQNAAKVVGPALGGVLIAAVGVGWCFAINAISFLATLAALAADAAGGALPARAGGAPGRAPALRTGFAYVRHSRELLTICAVAASSARSASASCGHCCRCSQRRRFTAARARSARCSPPTALGAVAGALANAAAGKTSSRRLFAGAILFTGSLLALSPVRMTAVACGLLFLAGVGWSTWSSQAMAHVQLAAPDQLRGRVISLYTYTIIATAPLGALLSGWLADIGGTELAFAVAGGIGLAAVIVGAVALAPNVATDPQESLP